MLGKGHLVIRGEITSGEDLEIGGQVEGRISAPNHAVVIAPGGRVQAEVFARSITIEGTASGSFTAAERIEISAGATVEGRLVAPRVALIEGAAFQGRVDPDRSEAAVRVARYRHEHPAVPNA